MFCISNNHKFCKISSQYYVRQQNCVVCSTHVFPFYYRFLFFLIFKLFFSYARKRITLELIAGKLFTHLYYSTHRFSKQYFTAYIRIDIGTINTNKKHIVPNKHRWYFHSIFEINLKYNFMHILFNKLSTVVRARLLLYNIIYLQAMLFGIVYNLNNNLHMSGTAAAAAAVEYAVFMYNVHRSK